MGQRTDSISSSADSVIECLIVNAKESEPASNSAAERSTEDAG
jgi:hypothetical protein